MYKAFGIVNSARRNVYVDGLQDYRPIGAFSFLGRYRVIDFPISNLSNSDIERIQVYTGNRPRSLVEHIGTGRHYNINSKNGKLQILFPNDNISNNYNTDICTYLYNMEFIEKMHFPYVVIVPSYMIYKVDFRKLLNQHVESGADITLLYHHVDNANEAYLPCRYLNLNNQKGVTSLSPNIGTAKNRDIFMDTYIMSKDLFVELVHKAKHESSMYMLSDIVNLSCETLDVRGVAHHGFFASITDFKSYFEANMALLDNPPAADNLFQDDWPIYTRTNDSAPTQYYEDADVSKCAVANGCHIEGKIFNSVIGRGCTIEKGAVVENSIVLAGTTITENTHVAYQVIDKNAKLVHMKEIISTAADPGYVRKNDKL